MQTFRAKLGLIAAFLLFIPFLSNAQMAPDSIDKLVARTLKTFDVPGMAVAIVKDGKIVFEKGYGVRSLARGGKVDENTLFGIASNSKAFTTAAIGILCDEGKLHLDDKVTDYIPEFRLYDPWVTSEFTIRDLLTHRSGLGLGAGDLMDFPDSTDFTMKDVIHNLRYFKPVTSFRSAYAYDNQLYKVAGEVVARVSGMSWEDFIEKRIMQPLGMTKSRAAFQRISGNSNYVDAHAPADGTVRTIQRYETITGDAAGGIYSSVHELSKWAAMQMDNGKYGDGKRLFSEAIHNEMWMPQTVIPIPAPGYYNTHFGAYGLGWFLNDTKGYKEVSHTGGIDGMVTKVDLIPELKLAIIVLTNQQSGAAFSAVTNQIKDTYLGLNSRNWVQFYADQVKSRGDDAKKVTGAVWKQVNDRHDKVDYGQYAGTYHDNWLGDIDLTLKDGRLFFRAERSPKLSGEVLPYKANTFVVKWAIRSMDADAFIMFSLDQDGKPDGFKMKPISPATDFSYDFQDLDVHRVSLK
ncbi:MAG: serine hydrolase [Bacteroidetes bacterium]|nr:serine hydrolase [Bacteroidota bacterium]